jgi:hypothetical protein
MPNGNYTITNLKSATGIADDRLSAHHPNGAGNETSMGEFALDDLGGGGNNNAIGSPPLETVLYPFEVDGRDVNEDPSGSGEGYDNSSPPIWTFDSDDNVNLSPDPNEDDTFKIWIDVRAFQSGAGRHFADQIGSRLSAHWAKTLNNNLSIDAIKPGGRGNGMYVKCTVTDFGVVGGFGLKFQGPMNDLMPNHDIEITFRSDDWDDGGATITDANGGQDVEFEDDNDSGEHQYAINPNGLDILRDPANNISNPTWELYLNNSQIASQTQAQLSFTTPSVYLEQSGGDTWRIDLKDSNGTLVDSLQWTWGDSNAPYDDNGTLPAYGKVRRDTNDQGTSSSPEPASIYGYNPDDSGTTL